MIEPVETPKLLEVKCSQRFTSSKKCSQPYWRDFHWESPNPPLVPVTADQNGTISTPVGCTIPLLINWLTLPDAATGG